MRQEQPHILLVDDEPDLLAVLQIHLADQGYAVTQINDGGEALAFLHTTPTAHVVLLDALMPRMDGVHLLEIIAHQPILAQQHRYALMTGWYTSHEAVSETLLTQVGAQLLHKPFDLARLNATVARLAHQLPPFTAKPPAH
jgi:DNA-binding NtrC family response regulator